MDYELVPPGNHKRNQADCAIQTLQAHFILILAGVNKKFPLSLWCHLLQPTELTLSLLCQSKVAPKISPFAHIHSPHNYAKKSFAPLGCAIQAHVMQDNHRIWDARADMGFNLGTSMEHHHCYHVYITKTRSTRINNTVAFQHQYITNPMVSPESHVIAVAQQLATALKGNIPMGNETVEALSMVSMPFAKMQRQNSNGSSKKTVQQTQNLPSSQENIGEPTP